MGVEQPIVLHFSAMNIHFDPTLTFGQLVHVTILVYCVWLMHRSAQRRLKLVDLKLDILLKHFGLRFEDKGGECTLNTPSQSET